MSTSATNACMPRAMFQTGVILSATAARGHDQPRTVRIGQEESGFEALAFSSPWLDEAVNGPLHAWVVQLAHAEGGSPLPILLGLEEEPFSRILELPLSRQRMTKAPSGQVCSNRASSGSSRQRPTNSCPMARLAALGNMSSV